MSISTTLGFNEAGEGHDVLGTVDVGDVGTPVYTTSILDWTTAGTTLATIVWNLDKELGTPISSIAVLTFSGLDSGLNDMSTITMGPEVLPVVTASFYEKLRDLYVVQTGSGGQQNSLVPLPMFLFDSNVRDVADLNEAKSKWEAWRDDLDGNFSSIMPSTVRGASDSDKKDAWAEAVKYLITERLPTDPARNDQAPRPKSPAYEKVRSILLHILCTCIFHPAPGGDLEQDFRNVCASEYGRAAQTAGTPPSTVEEFERFLGRYRYVTFADASWIQGCEADVVVACLPLDDVEAPIMWPLLSRARQQAIVVLVSDSEEEARSHWLGAWHDWDKEMKRHRANNNNP